MSNTTILSNKKDKMFSASLNEATKSNLLFKHGCVATYGGKIIARGCNTYKCYSANDKFINDQCSCHAEINVIRQICHNYSMKKRKLDRIMKKTTLYISRSSNAGESTNSAPCVKCLAVIKRLNVKKIIFNLDNEYFEYNSKDYHTTHRTFGDIYFSERTL
jgi:tRNA(Arg) A34 adenosine deaminase TadA